MASTLKKDTQERNDMKDTQEVGNKALCLKNDAEFKKIFGLTKDLRVCLTRIPDHLNSGKSFDAFTSLVKGDTYKKTEVMVKKAERKQGVDKKRKPKTVKKMDYAKKRKTESACNTGVNGETSVTSSQLRSSILPTSEVSQRNSLTSHKKSREEKRTDIEHYIHDNQEKGTLSSNASFEQSHSFNKNYTEDVFPMTPPELEETIRDEKIRRLKQVLREKEAALEEIRKKMHQK
ncbi:ligand-dependent nuclear receptor-interacting factor 1 isoform X3 [Loxodonta africana]|nr:ligand-dependent nuclear receptor-interacting factor 1 isoform X3 [Loxodonta africana]